MFYWSRNRLIYDIFHQTQALLISDGLGVTVHAVHYSVVYISYINDIFCEDNLVSDKVLVYMGFKWHSLGFTMRKTTMTWKIQDREGQIFPAYYEDCIRVGIYFADSLLA